MIPAMIRTLHLIDNKTPRDCLDQLALLAGEGEVIVSVGPPPEHPGLDGRLKVVHRPIGPTQLSGWPLGKLARQAEALHAWSPVACEAGLHAARHIGRPILRSLPCLPDAEQIKRLVAQTKQGLVLTVPTEAARAAMVARGIPDSCVYVLRPPARPIAEAPARRRRVREALGIDESDFLIVAPAEMTRYAGHRYVSWAHAIVRVMNLELRLLFPGGGPIARHVRFFAGTTGYDDEVHFTNDRFGREDTLASADAAALFVERDCGTAALAAAMAAGMPILASRTPDIAELAPHERVSLLAEPCEPRLAAAAIARLMEDRLLAGALARQGRARAEELFTPSDCCKRLEEIYDGMRASAHA